VAIWGTKRGKARRRGEYRGGGGDPGSLVSKSPSETRKKHGLGQKRSFVAKGDGNKTLLDLKKVERLGARGKAFGLSCGILSKKVAIGREGGKRLKETHNHQVKLNGQVPIRSALGGGGP